MIGSITVKNRPVKMAFLADINKKADIREIIRLNSSLWGGSYNPIIPLFKKRPAYWSDKILKHQPSVKDIALGYVKAFDPDVVVYKGALPEYIKKLDLVFVKLEDIWKELEKGSEEFTPSVGVGIFELLNPIYDEYFKYKIRFPKKVIIPQIPTSNSLFWSSMFGELSKEVTENIIKNYGEALDIETIKQDTADMKKMFNVRMLHPRRISQYKLDSVPRRGSLFNAYIFFMDASKNIDIVDFWNLRAAGKQAIGVPIQLKDDKQLQEIVTHFIKSVNKPLRYNPKIYDHASFLRSRSVSMEQMKEYTDIIGKNFPTTTTTTLGGHPFSLQHWYPRIWDDFGRDADNIDPEDVTHKEQDNDIKESNGEFYLKPLRPEFLHKHYGHSEAKYINEIETRLYSDKKLLAQVFPVSKGKNVLRTISQMLGFEDWRIGRNGLVKKIKMDIGEHWKIPNAQDIFFSWLKDEGFSPELSSPGIVARQILERLDGFTAVIANEKLIWLLEKMNSGSEVEEDNGTGFPIAKIISMLKEAGKSEDFLDFLVSKSMFKIGAKVKCPICLRHSWYSMENLKETMNCPKCLNKFSAIGNVNGNCWSYKTMGPFSIPNFAEGAYSVLLSMNFFSDMMSGLITTPCFSFNATENKSKRDFEADFGILYQESSVKGVAEGVIFGECKTFGEFCKKDFSRMRSLAKRFPGAILAFCTLRNKLKKREIKEIAKIAKTGRKYYGNQRPINPVIILTSNELFDHSRPPYCWKKLGLDKKFDRIYGLLDICNATQQIYLDLPSWYEFWDEEFKKKRVRRKNIKSEQGVGN
ncbi:MAG: hypothetical protein WAV73_04415 [Candidatus Moraniibacteriota bacterium]